MTKTRMRSRVLPVTGRRVPAEPEYVLSKMRQMGTSDGVAFTAEVRVGGRVVGLIENHGTGGGTWFSGATAADRKAWEEFERGYAELNPEPEPPGGSNPQTGPSGAEVRTYPVDWTFVPDAADLLFTEADLRKRLDGYVKRGSVVVRKIGVTPQEWQDDDHEFGTLRIKGHGWDEALRAAKARPDAVGYETYLPSRGWVPLREA